MVHEGTIDGRSINRRSDCQVKKTIWRSEKRRRAAKSTNEEVGWPQGAEGLKEGIGCMPREGREDVCP